MAGQPFPEIPCKICAKPVDLTVDLSADENGSAVHEDCYVKSLTSSRGNLLTMPAQTQFLICCFCYKPTNVPVPKKPIPHAQYAHPDCYCRCVALRDAKGGEANRA